MSNNKARLSIIMGLPGTGKTTFAKELVKRTGGVCMCADDWMDSLGFNLWDAEARGRVEKLQWRMTQELLSLGSHVIIEWGTWARAERDVLRITARNLGAQVMLYHLDAPLDVLYDRIAARGRENPPITRQNLEEWSATIERPTQEELALFDDPTD